MDVVVEWVTMLVWNNMDAQSWHFNLFNFHLTFCLTWKPHSQPPAMDARAVEDHKFKMHKLLLKKFQGGLWSYEDYHEQIKKLDAPRSASTQSSSPAWNVEEKNSLPDDSEDL